MQISSVIAENSPQDCFSACRRRSQFKSLFNRFASKTKRTGKKACSFCLAGVERFELPDDGVRVRSLTAWRYPIMELNRNVKRSLLRAPPLFSPYIIHAYSLFCKCFNAFSRKSSIFFAPSLKLKYNAVVSYRASWRLTSQSNSSAVLRVTS